MKAGGPSKFSLFCFVTTSCFATPRTSARWVPLSMGFPRQESWSGLPFLSPGDLPDPGIEPKSPALAGGCFTTQSPGKPPIQVHSSVIHNSQKVEITQMFINRWTDKQNVVFILGYYPALKKKEIVTHGWNEDILLSETGQSRKDRHCMIPPE